MRKAALNELKRAMAIEALHAVARLRGSGEGPTPETAPTLMAIWQVARDKLVSAGGDQAIGTCAFRGMRFQVASIWDANGRLHRFYLRDFYSGALLMTGSVDGPVFLLHGREHSAQPQAINCAVTKCAGTAHLPAKDCSNGK